jgi:hypothetical protein
LAVAALVACSREHGELELVDVRRADLVIGVEVSGELAAVDSLDVKPPALYDTWDFKIADLAAEGAEVKPGGVGEIEPPGIRGVERARQGRRLGQEIGRRVRDLRCLFRAGRRGRDRQTERHEQGPTTMHRAILAHRGSLSSGFI